MFSTSQSCPFASGSQSGQCPPSLLRPPMSIAPITSHLEGSTRVLAGLGRSCASCNPFPFQQLEGYFENRNQNRSTAQQALSPANLPDVIPGTPHSSLTRLFSLSSFTSHLSMVHYSVESFGWFLSRRSLRSLSNCGWTLLPYLMTFSLVSMTCLDQ